jgi:hypothetical protein
VVFILLLNPPCSVAHCSLFRGAVNLDFNPATLAVTAIALFHEG